MDRVLNLSAFGEILKKGNSLKTKMDSSPSDSDPNAFGHIFKMLLQNTAQTKLLHWQSDRYGQHKALDELFSKLNELGDQLAESLMGKYGKPVLSEDNLSLKLKNFEDPEKGDLSWFLDHLYKCYSIDCKTLLNADSDPELINLIDEILSLIDQIKYLLTLK
jgi:hypothetical protein